MNDLLLILAPRTRTQASGSPMMTERVFRGIENNPDTSGGLAGQLRRHRHVARHQRRTGLTFRRERTEHPASRSSLNDLLMQARDFVGLAIATHFTFGSSYPPRQWLG